jgi:hypothetical protein
MEIVRRTFLKAMAAGAVAYPLYPLFGMPPEAGGAWSYDPDKKRVLPLKAPVPPDEVKILGGYLTGYTPPPEPMSPDGGWTAVCDIISFETDVKIRKVQMSNSVMGQVAVSRSVVSPDYRIQMRHTPAQSVEELAATIYCNPDAVHSIQKYELVLNSRKFTRKEAGSVQRDTVRVAAHSSVEVLSVNNPVTCLWTMLDAVRYLPTDAGKESRFDLFMDLSSLRRNQTLKFVRAGEVLTAAGSIPVRFFRQIGTGVEPIHYAVDEQQRTLFATQGQLGWALNRIERM